METHDSVNDNSLTRSGKPQSPLLKYICKACYAAPGRSMSDNILRYTDLAALIQMARSRGLADGKDSAPNVCWSDLRGNFNVGKKSGAAPGHLGFRIHAASQERMNSSLLQSV